MSVETIARIANVKSPSDFLRAVMAGSGKPSIEKNDILCALTNHRSELGQHIMYYWLYEDQKELAEEHAIAAARGGWLVNTPFMADRKMLAKFGKAALSQIMRYQKCEILIADINSVTTDAIRKNQGKYNLQIEFFNQLVRVFSNSLHKSKEDFISHFIYL